jgi:heme A synthase
MAAAVGIMVMSLVPIVWIEARPREGADVAAIFAPWATRESAFARAIAAGGVVVRQGTIDTILVVHGGNPELVGRLYALGAWAVIDPVAFGGCLVKPPRATE